LASHPKFLIFCMEKFLILIFFSISPLIFKGKDSKPFNYETENTIFHEIVDTANVEHWYKDLRNGDLYCYRHSTWEHMEIRNSASLP